MKRNYSKTMIIFMEINIEDKRRRERLTKSRINGIESSMKMIASVIVV